MKAKIYTMKKNLYFKYKYINILIYFNILCIWLIDCDDNNDHHHHHHKLACFIQFDKNKMKCLMIDFDMQIDRS